MNVHLPLQAASICLTVHCEILAAVGAYEAAAARRPPSTMKFDLKYSGSGHLRSSGSCQLQT